MSKYCVLSAHREKLQSCKITCLIFTRIPQFLKPNVFADIGFAPLIGINAFSFILLQSVEMCIRILEILQNYFGPVFGSLTSLWTAFHVLLVGWFVCHNFPMKRMLVFWSVDWPNGRQVTLPTLLSEHLYFIVPCQYWNYRNVLNVRKAGASLWPSLSICHVGWSVRLLVGRMVCHNFPKGREVSLPRILLEHLFYCSLPKQIFSYFILSFPPAQF